MKVEAKPLTRLEWEGLRRDDRLPSGEVFNGDRHYKLSKGDADVVDRIEATIEHGWAPDEPTNDQLNDWAAKDIMRWHLVRSEYGPGRWVDPLENTAATTASWNPCRLLSQAFQVAMETDHALVIEAGPAREPSGWVTKVRVLVDGNKLHYGPFEPEVIARKVMLELHRSLEGET